MTFSPSAYYRGTYSSTQDLLLCVKVGVYMGFWGSSWVLITMTMAPVIMAIADASY